MSLLYKSSENHYSGFRAWDFILFTPGITLFVIEQKDIKILLTRLLTQHTPDLCHKENRTQREEKKD
jgi:hypothetical protein